MYDLWYFKLLIPRDQIFNIKDFHCYVTKILRLENQSLRLVIFLYPFNISCMLEEVDSLASQAFFQISHVNLKWVDEKMY